MSYVKRWYIEEKILFIFSIVYSFFSWL